MSKSFTLIDSHAHVQFPAYDQDREAVIRRALDSGVGVINVGTAFGTSEEAIRLAEKYAEGLWATIGFHPSHSSSTAHHDPWELREQAEETFAILKFRNIALHPKVVAIGECGLDYFRIKNQELGIKEKQEKILVGQIELALEVGKPLAIHCRPSAGTQDAYDDACHILNSYFLTHNSNLRGVMHFFVGSKETAKKFLGLGFYISFAGPITFAKEYEEVVKFVPLDRILVETDAPYATPAPYRGQRNEPRYVAEIARKIAEIKGILYDDVARQTLASTKTLFSLR